MPDSSHNPIAKQGIKLPVNKTFRLPVLFLATGFGSGYAPFAPGTFGSLVGVFAAYLASSLPVWGYVTATVFVTAIGIPIAGMADKIFNSKDNSKIVIDEVAGQMIALFLLPVSFSSYLLGFLFFRLFDIWKGPLRRLEKLPDGIGVMADDVGAGLLALGCTHLLLGLFDGTVF